MGAFGILLLVQHARLVTRNLTTNEAINFSKYDYLRDARTGRFKNPFNRGKCANIAEFVGLEWLLRRQRGASTQL